MAKKVNERLDIENEVFPLIYELQVKLDTLLTEHTITCCTHCSMIETLEDVLIKIKGEK